LIDEVITLGKLKEIVRDAKTGLDPDVLVTWYRIIENQARDLSPDSLKNSISIVQDPVLLMKFEIKSSKRVIKYLIQAIENNLDEMTFSTRLYFQKLQDIITNESAEKYRIEVNQE